VSNSLENEILIRGTHDIVQLAEVISVAYTDFNVPLGPSMLSAVTESIRSLLIQGFVHVGDLDISGLPLKVVPWLEEPDEIVGRIAREWTALNRDPGLSEICWLALTDEGYEVGTSLMSGT
jgi:hypothetical protein